MKKMWALALLMTLVFHVAPAAAVQGGAPEVGADDVVALFSGEYASRPICSAALVDKMIVATAAHCVTVHNNESGELSRAENDFWISEPGEDMAQIQAGRRYQVSKVFRSSGYVNIWRPDIRDYRTQKDDIAFLVLREPANRRLEIPLISNSELELIKQNGLTIRHIGYGLQSLGKIDGKPYSIELIANPLGSSRYSNNPALESNTITSNETGAKAICSGDSGSPWYTTIDGVKKLVAVTVGGSGCGGSGVNGALGTSVSGYIDLFANAKSAAAKNLKIHTSRMAKLANKKYKSCKAMNQNLPGGLAKSKTVMVQNSQSFDAHVSPAGYKINASLDKDKDGVACEK